MEATGASLPPSVVRVEPSSLLTLLHPTPFRAPVPKRLSLAPPDPGQVQPFLLSAPWSFSETLPCGTNFPAMPGNSEVCLAWRALSQALGDKQLRQGIRPESHSQ